MVVSSWTGQMIRLANCIDHVADSAQANPASHGNLSEHIDEIVFLSRM
jgi:hypothetical protein